MDNKNCKYVARLSEGSYIFKITEDKVYTCKSRLRARQFTLAESRILAQLQSAADRSRLAAGTVKQRAAVPMGNHNGEMDRLFAQWDQL
jgi:division protein CdvB (Snf7/Vps24/ESCRT-III family)